jgi:hypothetical protein
MFAFGAPDFSLDAVFVEAAINLAEGGAEVEVMEAVVDGGAAPRAANTDGSKS